jgi:hypothetical protein
MAICGSVASIKQVVARPTANDTSSVRTRAVDICTTQIYGSEMVAL